MELLCDLVFDHIVVVVDVVEAVVGHVLHVVVPDQGLTVVAALGDHGAGQDLPASGLAADLVANQHQGTDLNPGKGPENIPGNDQDLDQGIDQEKGQGKDHVVVQVALSMVSEGNLVNHPPQ